MGSTPPPRRRICPAPDRRPADRGNARPEAPEKPSRCDPEVSPTKNRYDLPQPSWKKSAFWKWGYTNKMIHSSLVSGDELTDVPTVDHRFPGTGRPWGRQKYPEWGYWPVILWNDHLPGSSVKPPLRRKLWIKNRKSQRGSLSHCPGWKMKLAHRESCRSKEQSDRIKIKAGNVERSQPRLRIMVTKGHGPMRLACQPQAFKLAISQMILELATKALNTLYAGPNYCCALARKLDPNGFVQKGTKMEYNII